MQLDLIFNVRDMWNFKAITTRYSHHRKHRHVSIRNGRPQLHELLEITRKTNHKHSLKIFRTLRMWTCLNCVVGGYVLVILPFNAFYLRSSISVFLHLSLLSCLHGRLLRAPSLSAAGSAVLSIEGRTHTDCNAVCQVIMRRPPRTAAKPQTGCASRLACAAQEERSSFDRTNGNVLQC